MQLDRLTRLGAGREAEVFAWDESRVLRLAYHPERAPRIKREAIALAAAHEAGAPVPALHEQLVVDGRPGLVLDKADGGDLLTRLGRRPWLVRSVGRAVGSLHAGLHEIVAPAELPSLQQELDRRLESDLVPADVRVAVTGVLGDLPTGDRLCHGDFHPGNVLGDGHDYVVIDWTAATRGNPEADVARTRLLILGGQVPDDAPVVVRRLDRLGRRLLFKAYLHAYRRAQPLDLALVNRWAPVCAAARLAEDIAGERESLLAIARR